MEMNSSAAISLSVSAGEQPEHVALARGEQVQLRVPHRGGTGALREGVEHETRQPRREHRIPGVHPEHGVHQLPTGDRLGDVAAGAGADDRYHVLGGVGHRQSEEHHVGLGGVHPAQHLGAATVGQVHVEQHDVRTQVPDARDRLVHRAGLADHRDTATGVGAAEPARDSSAFTPVRNSP